MASTSHLERTAEEPRQSELHDGRISRVDQANERVRLLRLELQSGPAEFSPGQWLDTYVPGIAKPGGFTITSAPSAAAAGADAQGRPRPPFVELAVQEAPANAVAAWLWRPVDQVLGSVVRVRIGGSFVFPPPSEPSLGGVGRVVFVAGGVGVNPLVSMLRFIAETPALGLDVCLVYATKLPASGRLRDVLFLESIAALLGQGKVRGRLRLYVTTGGDGQPRIPVETGVHQICGAHVEVLAGRPSGNALRHVVCEERPDSTLVYVCGPPTMTDELVAMLTTPGQGANIDPNRVLAERWW